MMADFRIMAVEAALKKMVSQKHFDICTLDNVITALELCPPKALYAELRLLHCVHYGDMPQALLQMLPDKLMQLLNCPRLETSRINLVPTDKGIRLVKH